MSISAALLLALAAPDLETVLHLERFELARTSEVVAVVSAACERCSWGRRGREAALLALSVDGRYSQHLILVRGEEAAEYRVALGALAPGAHALAIALDREATARGVRRTAVSGVQILATPEGTGDHAALAHAPILHARANTLGRFSDVPLLMWYETEPTPRGTRIRYSVVFSHEDGGTPADRLMATWGRVTDIEFVYAVELDGSGRILEEHYQGPEHKILPFAGRREGRHPLLWVVTDNNMVSDRGKTTLRYAPAPLAFGLVGVSREAVMDAHPWTYRVMSLEVARERLIVQNARPGTERIPSPQRFAYLEACGELQDATLGFAIGIGKRDGRTKWHESDGGRPKYRIARSGCFRGAVALPTRVPLEHLKALRFRAYTRPPEKGQKALPSGGGRVRLTRVNKLFLLRADLTPGRNLFSWAGDAQLKPGGPPLELPIGGPP